LRKVREKNLEESGKHQRYCICSGFADKSFYLGDIMGKVDWIGQYGVQCMCI